MGTVLFFFTKKLTTPRELSREELLVNGFYELPQERKISNFELKTSDGILLNNDFLLNKWTLIYFGFTRCPDECPVTMSIARDLFNTLLEKGVDISNLKLILISIDPEHDDKELINRYAKGFFSEFYGVQTSRPQLLSLATQLDVLITAPPDHHNEDTYHLDNHQNNLILINQSGNYHGFFRPPFNLENVLLTYQSVVF